MASYIRFVLITKRYQAISAVLVFEFVLSLEGGGCTGRNAFFYREDFLKIYFEF
jgi:hypothetical protein